MKIRKLTQSNNENTKIDNHRDTWSERDEIRYMNVANMNLLEDSKLYSTDI